MHSKSLFTAIVVALFAGAIASPVPELPTELPAEINAYEVTEPPQSNPDPVDQLAFDALQVLQTLETEGGATQKRSQQCTLRNVAVRREW